MVASYRIITPLWLKLLMSFCYPSQSSDRQNFLSCLNNFPKRSDEFLPYSSSAIIRPICVIRVPFLRFAKTRWLFKIQTTDTLYSPQLLSQIIINSFNEPHILGYDFCASGHAIFWSQLVSVIGFQAFGEFHSGIKQAVAHRDS